MTGIPFFLFIGLLISSCSSMTSTSSDSIPENMQPDWTGIDVSNIPVKFGQVVRFKNDSIELSAAVLDFDEDEGGKWIGLCFLNNNQLFGRQIPNGMINTTCLDLLDFTYLQIGGLNNYEIIQTLDISKNKVGIGARSPAANLTEILRDFKRGIEQRKKEQTPCNKGLTELNPVRECYFDIEKIKN